MSVFSIVKASMLEGKACLLKYALYQLKNRKSYLILGSLLVLLTLCVTSLYYLNRPYAETTADTSGYLAVVNQLSLYGNPLNAFRLPVYPLFILIVCALTGRGNLLAVSIVQGGLFVLTALEFYILVAFIFRRSWLAFLVSLVVGTNVILIAYSKPIMTEGLALWLLTTNILITIYILRTWNLRLLKVQAIFLVLLLFTRPEWLLLPLLLVCYLLFLSRDHLLFKPLMKRAIIVCSVLYALIGVYVASNAIVNHYVGLTTVENMNLVGKVIQYRMYNEATPEYASTQRIIARYAEHGQTSPYKILGAEPELAVNNAQPVSDFARSIILNHPVEFIAKTVPLLLPSLIDYYPVSIIPPPPSASKSLYAPSAAILAWLLSVHRSVYACNGLFPLCALPWLLLLCSRWGRKQMVVQAMSLVVLIALTGIIITALGGYYMTDDMRVHIVFDPLIILTVWGTLLYSLGIATTYCWKTISGYRSKTLA